MALYGAGDLAEIAILSAGETAVEVLCVIDPEQSGRRCGGLPVVADVDAALNRSGPHGLDGIIVTDTRTPQANFERLLSAAELSGWPRGAVVAPSLLRISPNSAHQVEESAP